MVESSGKVGTLTYTGVNSFDRAALDAAKAAEQLIILLSYECKF